MSNQFQIEPKTEISPFEDHLIKGDVVEKYKDYLLKAKEYDLDCSIKDIPKDNGIYLFKIKCPNNDTGELKKFIEDFSEKWKKREEEEKVGKFPKISSRIKKDGVKSNDEWIPFYLGISKELQKRIRLHISLETDSTSKDTYALKLKRSKSLEGYKFKFSFLYFGDLKERYFLCEILELLLREEIKPIIGE